MRRAIALILAMVFTSLLTFDVMILLYAEEGVIDISDRKLTLLFLSVAMCPLCIALSAMQVVSDDEA